MWVYIQISCMYVYIYRHDCGHISLNHHIAYTSRCSLRWMRSSWWAVPREFPRCSNWSRRGRNPQGAGWFASWKTHGKTMENLFIYQWIFGVYSIYTWMWFGWSMENPGKINGCDLGDTGKSNFKWMLLKWMLSGGIPMTSDTSMLGFRQSLIFMNNTSYHHHFFCNNNEKNIVITMNSSSSNGE